jgi:hypothetical protein
MRGREQKLRRVRYKQSSGSGVEGPDRADRVSGKAVKPELFKSLSENLSFGILSPCFHRFPKSVSEVFG